VTSSLMKSSSCGLIMQSRSLNEILRLTRKRVGGKVVLNFGDYFLAPFRLPQNACVAKVNFSTDLRRTVGGFPVYVPVSIHDSGLSERNFETKPYWIASTPEYPKEISRSLGARLRQSMPTCSINYDRF